MEYLDWNLRHWPFGDCIRFLLNDSMSEWVSPEGSPPDSLFEVGIWGDVLSFHLLKHILVIFPVGFQGNLRITIVVFLFSQGA